MSEEIRAGIWSINPILITCIRMDDWSKHSYHWRSEESIKQRFLNEDLHFLNKKVKHILPSFFQKQLPQLAECRTRRSNALLYHIFKQDTSLANLTLVTQTIDQHGKCVHAWKKLLQPHVPPYLQCHLYLIILTEHLYHHGISIRIWLAAFDHAAEDPVCLIVLSMANKII